MLGRPQDALRAPKRLCLALFSTALGPYRESTTQSFWAIVKAA
jgi:hypothetical protein